MIHKRLALLFINHDYFYSFLIVFQKEQTTEDASSETPEDKLKKEESTDDEKNKSEKLDDENTDGENADVEKSNENADAQSEVKDEEKTEDKSDNSEEKSEATTESKSNKKSTEDGTKSDDVEKKEHEETSTKTNSESSAHDIYTGEVHDPNINPDERHNYRPINIMFRRKCQNPNIRIQFDRTVILKNQTFYLNVDGKNVRLIASPQSIETYDDIRTLLEIVNDISLNSCCVELATHVA